MDLDMRVAEWEEAEEMLKLFPRAWDRLYTLEALEELYKTGKLFGYILQIDNSKILALFEIYVYPKARVLRLSFLVGSNLQKFKGLVNVLDDLARLLDCSIIDVTGRAGFARFLPEGYKEVSRTWFKEIGEENGSSQ